MTTHRNDTILAAAVQAGLPSNFAAILQAECLWLDGEEEVSEELGPELLAGYRDQAPLSLEQINLFFDTHNAIVRSHSNLNEVIRSQAYAEVLTLLAEFGREDAFGGGDFWLVSDSFSERVPTVVVFGGFRFPPLAVRSLQQILSSYQGVFGGLRIACEQGEEITVLAPSMTPEPSIDRTCPGEPGHAAQAEA